MSDSSLCRLHAWSKRHACAVVAVADEDSFEDPTATALLRFIFGDVEDLGSRPELVLVVTPHRVQLHCSASALDGARALLVTSGSPVPVDVFCPGPQLSLDSDAVLDFKLEATRRMLHGARDEAPSLLAGLSPLAEAATRWPLLRAASLGDATMERPAAGSTQKAAAALHMLLRSVGQDALHCEGGVGSRALRVSSGFSRLVKLMDRVESTHEMRELTEKRLDAALRGADALFEAPPAGSTPPPEDLPCGVWLGARTELSLEQPGGKKLPVRASGPHSRAGRHMIARLSDGGGLAATRTFFLSNGRVCHHWQHRVFPDGDVLEPLVEDEVPEVDGAAGVQRAMRLYCELIAAAADVVAAVAARAPDALADHEAASILQHRISAAKEAGLLPARYDVAANARVRLGHALCSSPLDPALAAGCGVDAAATAAAEAPLHWQVHSVSLALMGLPRVGLPDTGQPQGGRVNKPRSHLALHLDHHGFDPLDRARHAEEEIPPRLLAEHAHAVEEVALDLEPRDDLGHGRRRLAHVLLHAIAERRCDEDRPLLRGEDHVVEAVGRLDDLLQELHHVGPLPELLRELALLDAVLDVDCEALEALARLVPRRVALDERGELLEALLVAEAEGALLVAQEEALLVAASGAADGVAAAEVDFLVVFARKAPAYPSTAKCLRARQGHPVVVKGANALCE